MSSPDPREMERHADDAIRAFLVREAARRIGQRQSDAEAAAEITLVRARRRPSLALGALAAVTILVGLGLVGSAVLSRPSHSTEPSPSPSASAPALHLPALAPGQACPVTQPGRPAAESVPVLGDGPVRISLAQWQGAAFFEATTAGASKAIDVLWTAGPDFSGQALVRGARLDAPGELRFGDGTDSFIVTPVYGAASTLGGQWLLSKTPIRVQGAGCYGLQIDAGATSSIVVFEARPIEDAFAQLARPLQLPRPAGAVCPITTATTTTSFMGSVLGSGPLYLASDSTTSIRGSSQLGGYWFIKTVWIADPVELGPILARGARIDAPGGLRFGDGSVPANELRLGIRAYEHTDGQPPGWRIFVGYLRPPTPGCYAIQLDTLAGSQWLVFDVTR